MIRRGRLQETSGTGITFREMQYDGLDLIAEYDGSGTLTARYVHGPGADEPLVQYAGTSVSTGNGCWRTSGGGLLCGDRLVGRGDPDQQL